MDGNAVNSVVQALLSDVVQPVLEVGAFALAAWLVRLAQKYLGVRINADQQARIDAATKIGAQAAYGLLANRGLQISDALSHQVAIAHGAQIAVSQLRPILATGGVTDDTVRQLVESRLGGLLAVDPTVSVSAPVAPAADPAPPAVPVAVVGDQPKPAAPPAPPPTPGDRVPA